MDLGPSDLASPILNFEPWILNLGSRTLDLAVPRETLAVLEALGPVFGTLVRFSSPWVQLALELRFHTVLDTRECQVGPGPTVLGLFERQVGFGPTVLGTFEFKLALDQQFCAPLSTKLALDRQFWSPLKVNLALDRPSWAILNNKLALKR